MSPNATHTAHCLVRGSINIDEFFHVRDIVRPGETISSTGYERRPGGKGANQACAIAKAGGSVRLLGVIGTDGRWVASQLEEYGVDVDGVEVTNKQPTGRAIIQLSGHGLNSIVLLKGANFEPLTAALSGAERPVGRPVRRPVTHVLLQNEIPWSSTLECLAFANYDATTIFNPSPMPTPAEITDLPWDNVDWLVVNETEARDVLAMFDAAEPQMPALLPPSLASAPDVARALFGPLACLLDHPRFSNRVHLVCTLGPDGVLAMFPRRGPRAPGGVRAIYVPAARLHGDVRDSTGAGDCFTGYLVAGLMQLHERFGPDHEMTEEEARGLLRRSVQGRLLWFFVGLHHLAYLLVQAAGMCVERSGAMESQPFAMEVDERLVSSQNED